MFSKDLYGRHVKTRACLEKGLKKTVFDRNGLVQIVCFCSNMGNLARMIVFVNSFPVNKPAFLPVLITSHLKILRDKEKLLITSKFKEFADNVSYVGSNVD